MTLAEYRRFYLDLILGILGGNHAHFAITMPTEVQRKAEYDNYRAGFTVLALMSLIEANFLSKSDLKALRNFQSTSSIPATINQRHLSGFIYLRDCFAHNPLAILLSSGANTTAFLAAISAGQFPFASISGQNLRIEGTHELHLLVLRFFGENV
jgi:hypothetical protein